MFRGEQIVEKKDPTVLRTLTIGVPVHNEEAALPAFFESLVKAINELPRSVDVEVIFCLNGSTDGSEKLLREHTGGSTRMSNMQIIESQAGKMNAQQEIVAKRGFKGPICFADSDIVMEPNTLRALMQKIESDPKCQVAYAHVEPYYDGAQAKNDATQFSDILFTHYNYRKFQPSRNYFHGRTFMLRDSSMLEDINKDLDERVKRVANEENPWYVTHLGLDKGPLVDDIYLSRAIVHEHGVGAISEVADARIWFHPPSRIEDYFRVIERTQAEIKRLDLLYPEHAYIQDTVFKREFRDAALYMPEGERLKYRMLIELETCIRERANQALIPPDEKQHQLAASHWMRAGSTKKPFPIETEGHAGVKFAGPDKGIFIAQENLAANNTSEVFAQNAGELPSTTTPIAPAKVNGPDHDEHAPKVH